MNKIQMILGLVFIAAISTGLLLIFVSGKSPVISRNGGIAVGDSYDTVIDKLGEPGLYGNASFGKSIFGSGFAATLSTSIMKSNQNPRKFMDNITIVYKRTRSSFLFSFNRSTIDLRLFVKFVDGIVVEIREASLEGMRM